jgi:hypothetical protein
MQPETSLCCCSTETNPAINSSISLLYTLHSLWQRVSAYDSGHLQVNNMQKNNNESNMIWNIERNIKI